jgi:hypothetical protein
MKKKSSFVILLVLTLLLFTSYVDSATIISDCYNISSPGDYILDSNISYGGADDCIKVNVGNVSIDCQNNVMTGPTGIDVSAISAIMPSQSINFSISNCIFYGWHWVIEHEAINEVVLENISIFNPGDAGIDFYDVSSISIDNVNISGGNGGIFVFGDHANSSANINLSRVNIKNVAEFGIILENLIYVNIVDSVFEGGHYSGEGKAIDIRSSLYYSKFVSNTIKNSNYGIYYDFNGYLNAIAGSNNFTENIIENNSIYGLYYDGTVSNQKFWNNIVNNTNNIFIPNGFSFNYFNIDKQRETNIIGERYKGGNYWDNYTGTNGFSETCVDSDRDAICDSSYVINNENSTDFLPLTIRANNNHKKKKEKILFEF